MTDPVLPAGGGVRKLIANSTITNNSNIITASAVEFKEKWQSDNDLFKRYSIVYNPVTCTFSEVVDCNGLLEKTINPYRKGLIGNFRGFRDMVFYGERKEDDPVATTNLLQNGFLKDFQLYWNFNAHHNLIPPVAATKWVWNTQVTKINSRGLELETKDALNIYTSAQYGYRKTVPVAVTSNSRYNEMFFEGFEDRDYRDNLSGPKVDSCGKKHIDFAGVPNSQVINTDGTGLNAHSGKHVLSVNASSSAVKTIAIKNAIVDSFTFKFTKDTAKSLHQVGLNIDQIEKAPPTLEVDTVTHPYISQNTTMMLRAGVIPYTVSNSGGYVSYGYTIHSSNYVEITTGGVYQITTDIVESHQASSTFAAITFAIKTLDGIQIPATLTGTNDPIKYYQVCLPKGIYKIFYYTHSDYICQCQDIPGAQEYIFDLYTSPPYAPITGYKSLSTVNGCIKTVPISTTDSMLNPVFTIPANKKMIFSGWVKEACGNPQGGIPCTVPTYANNQVNLVFNDGGSQTVVIKPSGPIIDGWQRYEGHFTPPAGATQMDLRLVNNSGQPIYFDDIRIHPFNANMQSYVYDPVSLRLTAQLDANNYASFYEYDAEGTLIRTKVETKDGIKTIKESRSAKQKNITTF
jgi:hypothetical protein